MGVEQSGFWFHARLAPPGDAHFFLSSESIGDGLELEVVWDALCLWSRADLDPPQRPWREAVRSPEEAERIFRLIAAAYALLTYQAFEVRFGGWVEATEAQWRDTFAGFAIDRFDTQPRRRPNRAMQASARLAVAANHAPGTRLALLDLHAAAHDRGDDAFFYAYRAVEDLARHYGEGEVDWNALHRHCGYQRGRARLKPLTEARMAIAHGDESDPAVQRARANRRRLLNLAR